MCTVSVERIYRTTIELDDLETRLFKQIMERAENISLDLGAENETLRQRLLAKLPEEM